MSRLEAPSWSHPLGTDELGRDELLRLLWARPRLASRGPGGGTRVRRHRLGRRAPRRLLGRAPRCLPHAGDRRRHSPSAPAAPHRARRRRPGEARPAGVYRRGREPQPLPHHRDRGPRRLDAHGAARAQHHLSVREREFVLAARAAGAGPLRIMLVHILPNAVSPIIVATTLSIGGIILFESVLSFLGLGIQPPAASWGNMLSGGLRALRHLAGLGTLSRRPHLPRRDRLQPDRRRAAGRPRPAGAGAHARAVRTAPARSLAASSGTWCLETLFLS